MRYLQVLISVTDISSSDNSTKYFGVIKYTRSPHTWLGVFTRKYANALLVQYLSFFSYLV